VISCRLLAGCCHGGCQAPHTLELHTHACVCLVPCTRDGSCTMH
jgi:hypothetical protein